MSDLKEDLERALRVLPVGPAPVERARRDGRRLRVRRRLSLIAGLAVAVALSAGVPALTGTSAAPVTPAAGNHQTPVPEPTITNGDPVVKGGAGDKTIEGRDGLETKDGVVATGQVGSMPWQLTIVPPGPKSPLPGTPCYSVTIILAGSSINGDCSPLVNNSPGDGQPAKLRSTLQTPNELTVGEATADVAYFIVTFTDGQQLKLIPVTAYGHRYVAWLAPLSMTVDRVEAYLGAAYATSGQVATAVPFSQPGQPPVFNLWTGPGLPAAPRASTVVLSGTASGQPWTLTVYAGPWGTCSVGSPGTTECVPAGKSAKTTGTRFLGAWGEGRPAVVWGTVAPGTATFRVKLSDGTTAEAKPRLIGGQELFAFRVGQGVSPVSWTTYDASGHQTSTGAITAVTVNPATGAVAGATGS